MTAEYILDHLIKLPPVRTTDLPHDQRGIYGLIDHSGNLRYIGSTSGAAENFRKRIHQRHRTGSESHSHYFSKVYNCGRMWRDRSTQQDDPDAKIAKDLRSTFVAEYCRAVYFSIEGTKQEIERQEAAVIAIAPRELIRWNRSTTLTYPEPTQLVDDLLERIGFTSLQRQAIERQNLRWQSRSIA